MPKLTGIGKVTLNSKLKVNRFSASQTEKYKKYPHLAYERRNGFGVKPSFASGFIHLDIFLSIYQLRYRIKFYFRK